MNAVALIKDTTSPKKEKSKTRKRRRIQLIETPPQPDWTIQVKDEQGKWVWYTRVRVTGLLPRRYGPFKTKGQALLFLDDLLNAMGDAIDSEGAMLAEQKAVKRQYAQRPQHCIHEDELGQAYFLEDGRFSKKGD